MFHYSRRPLVFLTLTSFIWGQVVPPLLAQPPLPPTTVNVPQAVDVDWLTAVRAVPFLDQVTHHVDPLSGSLNCSVHDLTIDAGTTTLEVHRFKRLEPGLPGVLGTGWRLNWEKRALRNAQVAVIEEGVGLTVFQPATSGSKSQYRTGSDGLTFSGDKAIRTLPDGVTEVFDGNGRLVERVEMDGTQVRVKYDSRGRLQRVEGPFGSYLSFELDSHGQLDRIESSTGATVSYFFGSDERATDRDSITLHYSYDKLGRLASVTHPQQGEVTFTYDGQGRVVQQQWGDGATAKYDYETNTTRHTDAAGYVTEIRMSDDGRRVGTIDPLGHRRTVELNESGQMISIRGPTGASSTLQYDERGRMTRVDNPRVGTLEMKYKGDGGVPSEFIEQGVHSHLTLADGHLVGLSVDGDDEVALSVDYDDDGLPIALRRGATIETRFDYDSSGRVAAMMIASGSTTRFEYDRLGNIVRETDARGNQRRMTYDSLGRLVRETDPVGGLTSYRYGETGLVQRITAPNGGSTEYGYDARGRVTKITDSLGRSQTYEYSPRGRVTAQHDSNGATTKYEYDGNGNLIAQVDAIGGVARWSYDELGALTEMQDAVGLTTRRVYNERGLLAELQYADGTWVRYEHDERGQRIAEVDDRGARIAYRWSPSGRLIKSQAEGKPLQLFQYDAFGKLVEAKLGDQVVVRHRYDAQGRVIETTSADGRVARHSYDANDNLVAWQDNSGAKGVFEYDANDQPIMVRNSFGDVTRYRYDGSGNQIEAVDPLGNISRSRYSLADELIEFTAPNGDQALCEYADSGLVSAVTQPNGVTSRYEYDGLGNVLRSVDPVRGETKYEYDQAGRLIRQTDAKEQVTKFAYDAAGNLATKQFADGTTVTFRYDRDRLIEVDDGKFPVQYEYDKWGNRTKIHYPAIGKTLVYHYDDRDRVTSFEDGTGRTIHSEYDQADRVTKVEFDEGKSIDLTYDTSQRTQGVAFPNGVTGVYQYDTEGRVSSLKWASKRETLASWRHAYDAGGYRTKTIDQDGQETAYRYDAAGQLLEEKRDDDTVAYSYAPGGQRRWHIEGNTETTYEYNDRGQLVKAGEETFAYDANGNLVRRRDGEGETKYEYDAENRLVKVELPSGATVEYGYAPTGERIWRSDEHGKKYYLSDGLHVVAELDEHFVAVTSFIQGPGVDWPLAVSVGEDEHYLLADTCGNIRAQTNLAGVASAVRDYDAFGNLLGSSGESACPFSFDAREYDDATGLYYFRARWYDPDIGSFLTPDPISGRIAQPNSLNPYIFAWNNPIRFGDALGTDPYLDDVLKLIGHLPPDQQASRLRSYLNSAENAHTFRVAGNGNPAAFAGSTIEQDRQRIQSMRKMLDRVERGLPPVKASQMPPPPPAPPPKDNRPTKAIKKPTTTNTTNTNSARGTVQTPQAPPSTSTSPSSSSSGNKFPKGYVPKGGGGFGSSSMPPPVGTRIKGALQGLGGKVKNFVRRFGPLGAVVGIGLAGSNVANADPANRGNVAAREGGGLLGGSAGGLLGGAGAAALVPSLGLGPIGPVIVIGLGLAGSHYGTQIGSNVGGHLVPPGSAGPDASDFQNPNAGGNRPPPPGTVITLPGIDPSDFKPPPPDPGGIDEQTTSYQVIYQCTICKKIHDGGTFRDPARASLAGNRFKAEGYRVSIVPRKVTQ